MQHLRNLLLTVVTVVLALPAAAQEFKAGVARADITPPNPIRLAGYASRTKPSESVDLHIFTKALALQDQTGAITLIVTADTIGTPRWFNDELAGRIEKELKIPRERFLFACSHSHSTPVVDGALTDMYGLAEPEAAEVKAYTKMFLQKSFEAASSAVKSMEPVRLSFGRGEAFFAGNRRQFGPKGVGFGINPNGPVDNDVPVLQVNGTNGVLKAVLFGYACHCTTPGATYEVSGDWAGYAQANLEAAYPGSTAMFITGCGADANPNPRGSMLFARAHGLQLAGSVARVLSEPELSGRPGAKPLKPDDGVSRNLKDQMRPVLGPIRAAFDRADLPLEKTPDRDYYQTKLKESAPATQRYAKRHLEMLERGEKFMTNYSAPLQVLRFGDAFTLIAISGETCVDYSLRLHRELPEERLWNAGYCNDVFAYVPSMRILTEGGYEADFNLIYYGFPTRFAPAVEDTLVKKVLELVRRTAPAASH